jgi:hypothetical protein
MLSLRAAEPAPTVAQPDRGVLVLRNGQNIQGRISRQDGVYVIDLGDGQIRVKAAEVELVCSSLEDGYRQKRAAISPGYAHGHLALAQWCLRHGLLGQAAVELADATAAEPDNPLIGVLQQRLKMALEPPTAPKGFDRLAAGPSNEELDRMIRSLPRGTVEMFTQSVQPVLMNHCAAAECHGSPAGGGLRLFRVPIGKVASRRITQRNLYSVLPYMDRQNPVGSRLLTVPNGPHGTAKYAIFNAHEAGQYKRVFDWAYQLSQQPSPRESQGPPTLATTPSFEAIASEAAQGAPQTLPPDVRKPRPLSTDGVRNPAHKPAKSAADVSAASFDRPIDSAEAKPRDHRYSPTKRQPPTHE